MRFFRGSTFRWLIAILIAGAFALWLGLNGGDGLPAVVLR